MRIGLVDVDGKGSGFPNLALMKISAYHKAQGDVVEWANPMFGSYDKVYKSKVFTFSEEDGDIATVCAVLFLASCLAVGLISVIVAIIKWAIE